jgi:hypothetical protein
MENVKIGSMIFLHLMSSLIQNLQACFTTGQTEFAFNNQATSLLTETQFQRCSKKDWPYPSGYGFPEPASGAGPEIW